MPAAKEQSRGKASDGKHSDVLCHEERCVFETGILGHVAGYNLRFDSTRPDTKNKMNAVAPHGVKTNQRGTTPNVYPACAATILSGVSEPTTITTGSTVIMRGSS